MHNKHANRQIWCVLNERLLQVYVSVCVCLPDGPLLVQGVFISVAQASVFVCVNGSDQFVFLQSQHYKSNIDKVGTLYGNLTHICVILPLSGSFIHKHTYERSRAQVKKRPFHRGQVHQESWNYNQSIEYEPEMSFGAYGYPQAHGRGQSAAWTVIFCERWKHHHVFWESELLAS